MTILKFLKARILNLSKPDLDILYCSFSFFLCLSFLLASPSPSYRSAIRGAGLRILNKSDVPWQSRVRCLNLSCCERHSSRREKRRENEDEKSRKWGKCDDNSFTSYTSYLFACSSMREQRYLQPSRLRNHISVSYSYLNLTEKITEYNFTILHQ